MSLPSSERARWALVVAVGALLLAAFHVWWIATHRYGYPLNIDEAGYTAIGVIDYIGFRTGGIEGWWDAVQTQAPNAPLVPTMTSLVLLIKPGVMEGFGVLIGFFVLLTLATYGIGERLAGPRLGALAALVVATSHGTFLFTREYVFALPTAALLAATMYSLIRSEGLRSRRWAIAAGFSIGLMLLARTMAVAFVPGIFAAVAIVSLARSREDLGVRALNLTLTALAAAATAATWYLRNLQAVVDYLTNYGYGAQSNYYGAENSAISWERFSSILERMIFDDLLVPLAALIAVGLLVLAVLAVRRVLGADDRRAALLRLTASDAAMVALVVIAGYAALMSSQNGGNGFTYPLAVLLPPLAVIALRQIRVAAAILVAILVILISAVSVAANTNLWEDLSRPRLVALPAVDPQPWISGLPHAVSAVRDQAPGPPTEFDTRDEGWTEGDEALVDFLMRSLGPDGPPALVAFASRNRILNTNSVTLAALLGYQRSIPLTQLSPEPDDTVRTYVRQLTDPAFGRPTAVVTMSRNTDDYEPLVTQSYVETAARNLGFGKVKTMRLPDGRLLRVWVKGCAAPRKTSAQADCPPGSRPG